LLTFIVAADRCLACNFLYFGGVRVASGWYQRWGGGKSSKDFCEQIQQVTKFRYFDMGKKSWLNAPQNVEILCLT
jgi:hypothetical protein